MLDLGDRVKLALANLGDDPWLPGLSEELVKVGWQNLYYDMGLLPIDYGTARVMVRDANIQRRILARLFIAASAENPCHGLQVEALEGDFASNFEKAGIRFYTTEEISDSNILEQLEEAINILKFLPSLFATVGRLVKSVHLIDPRDDDYDVSFSEPHVPFTIFVSVPRQRDPTVALRVAEAVVHEAMHLQLTLIELVVPLVNKVEVEYFSPWREEYRTVQGVLHALYVFRVIDRFLFDWSESSNSGTKASSYARTRRSHIRTQIDQIESFPECDGLTDIGIKFVRQLIKGY
jgi:HEXXH motif-containing protein